MPVRIYIATIYSLIFYNYYNWKKVGKVIGTKVGKLLANNKGCSTNWKKVGKVIGKKGGKVIEILKMMVRYCNYFPNFFPITIIVKHM